jgi:hypothetical protein
MSDAMFHEPSTQRKNLIALERIHQVSGAWQQASTRR